MAREQTEVPFSFLWKSLKRRWSRSGGGSFWGMSLQEDWEQGVCLPGLSQAVLELSRTAVAELAGPITQAICFASAARSEPSCHVRQSLVVHASAVPWVQESTCWCCPPLLWAHGLSSTPAHLVGVYYFPALKNCNFVLFGVLINTSIHTHLGLRSVHLLLPPAASDR